MLQHYFKRKVIIIMDINACKNMCKNLPHKLNYAAFMSSIPESLQPFANIQAVMWFIALIEVENRGKTLKIFNDVSRLLPSDFFKNSDTESIANTYALYLWNATCLAYEDKFMKYFSEAWSLGLAKILKQD